MPDDRCVRYANESNDYGVALLRNVKKQHLPTKVCAACGRPFAWRRKWERVWDEVRYCSDRCRAEAKRARIGAAAHDEEA